MERSFGFSGVTLPGRTMTIRGKDLVSLHANWGVRRWLGVGRFDALVVAGWSSPAHVVATLAARRMRLPVVLWSGSTANETGILRSVSTPFVRRIVAMSSWYAAYGTAAKSHLVSLGADAARVAIAINTVDVLWWAQQAKTAGGEAGDPAAQRKERTVRFLYAGQLIERKGIDLLLAALAGIQQRGLDASLTIAGSGPLRLTCGTWPPREGRGPSPSSAPRLTRICQDCSAIPTLWFCPRGWRCGA